MSMSITKVQLSELKEYLEKCVKENDVKAISIKRDEILCTLLTSYLRLRNTLEIANHQYRNTTGEGSALSDQLFDFELKLLERMEADLPNFKEIGNKLFGKESITSRVG